MIEAITQVPTYFLLGSRSIFGAYISDAFLNVKMGRINGLIGDGPFHGIYMTMIAMVSLYFFFTSERLLLKIICPFVFLMSGFNILGTGSRGALLSLLIGLLIFWILAEVPHKTAFMISILAACIILATMMLVFTPHINVSRSYTYSEETSSTAQMRWDNIPVSVRMFLDHPIFGTGPDGFIINYRRYAIGLLANTSREKTLKTHNTPLQVLAEYGIVGLTLFTLILIMAIKRMIEVRRYGNDHKDRVIAVTLLSVIAAYLFFMLTSNSLLDKYFWLMITMSQIHYSISELATAQHEV
jgi:O-antigen ligase